MMTSHPRYDEVADLRNRAEQLCYQAKAAARKLKAEDKDRVEAARKKAQAALDRKDDAALPELCDTLEAALNAAGSFTDSPGEQTEDGAMDAEYTSSDKKDE